MEVWQPDCHCCASSNSPPSCREQVLKLAQAVDCDLPSCQVWMDNICPSQAVSDGAGSEGGFSRVLPCAGLCRCMVQDMGVWLLCGHKGGMSGLVRVPHSGAYGMSGLCLLRGLLSLYSPSAGVQSCDLPVLRVRQTRQNQCS